MTYRLGVDMGGTFIDMLLTDVDSGKVNRGRTHSARDDQSIGRLHGTTATTNTSLERKKARVELVVAEVALRFSVGCGENGTSKPFTAVHRAQRHDRSSTSDLRPQLEVLLKRGEQATGFPALEVSVAA